MTCAPSEDSDQPEHPPTLIRVFAVRTNIPWVLSYQHTTKTLVRLGTLLILKQLFHSTFLAITAGVLMEECDKKLWFKQILGFNIEWPFTNNTRVQILKELIISGPYTDFWKGGGGANLRVLSLLIFLLYKGGADFEAKIRSLNSVSD